MLLDKQREAGLCVVRDCPGINGEVVVFSLIRKKPVVVVTIRGRNKQLQQRYEAVVDRLDIIYFDNFQTTQELGNAIETAGKVVVFDMIDLLMEQFGTSHLCSLLYKLRKSHTMLIHCPHATVTLDQFQALQSMAESNFILSKRPDQQFLADCQAFKLNGKMMSSRELFTVDSDFRLTSKVFVPQEEIVPEASSSMPADELTTPFDMGLQLKDSERNAKNALELPYTANQMQQGLVNLRSNDKKVRVGGQVIYTPDDADDLDDSDPDDDLNL